jgi:hypothetical protein
VEKALRLVSRVTMARFFFVLDKYDELAFQYAIFLAIPAAVLMQYYGDLNVRETCCNPGTCGWVPFIWEMQQRL